MRDFGDSFIPQYSRLGDGISVTESNFLCVAKRLGKLAGYSVGIRNTSTPSWSISETGNLRELRAHARYEFHANSGGRDIRLGEVLTSLITNPQGLYRKSLFTFGTGWRKSSVIPAQVQVSITDTDRPKTVYGGTFLGMPYEINTGGFLYLVAMVANAPAPAKIKGQYSEDFFQDE